MTVQNYAANFRRTSMGVVRALATLTSAIAFAVCAADLPESNPIQNPGFELSDVKDDAQPLAWLKSNPRSLIALDASVTWQGKRSLRIQRVTDTTGFVGVAQSGIPAERWRGKVICVQAMFKAAQLGTGSAGIFLIVADASRKTLVLGNSFGTPLPVDTEWTLHEAFIHIPVEAETIAIGAGHSSRGRLWVDGFELSEVRSENLRLLSDDAQKYLDDAINIVESIALNTSKVNWPLARLKAYAQAQGANASAETYAAIRAVLSELNDRHSFLLPPSEAKVNSENTSADSFQLVSETLSGKAYVSVPAYSGEHRGRQTAFANELQARLGKLSASSPCGWIVDLRSNTGGSMWPTLAGLAPILGNGVFGYLVGSDRTLDWFVRDNASGTGSTTNTQATQPVPLIVEGKATVAVLFGAATGSSGEAITVSFIGRPHTRSFGQPTAGLSTGNRTVKLSDGATLVVTTTVFSDRNGKRYGGKIEPDEPVAAGPKGASLTDDPVVKAAIAWLDRQPGCRK